jgi:hypothetical protein
LKPVGFEDAVVAGKEQIMAKVKLSTLVKERIIYVLL